MAMIHENTEEIMDDTARPETTETNESADGGRRVFSYDALFPALPSKAGNQKPKTSDTSNDSMRVGSNTLTQVCAHNF